MGDIKDIIDAGKNDVNQRCHENAIHIISHPEFLENIRDAVDDNESETSFYIDEMLAGSPSDSEWELIIRVMVLALEDEGVEITNYGWEEDEENDENDYWIYLKW